MALVAPPLNRSLILMTCLGLLGSVVGAAWLARNELVQLREAFETDARIAHRLLSQQVVQHDAILATLVLLQPGGVAESAPEQRLPSVYPQVLRVLRRDRGTDWRGTAPDAAALREAEAASRRLGRATLASVDLAAGRYTLVRAAEPASFALQIDVAAMVPRSEWPIAAGGPVSVRLVQGLQQRELQPAQARLVAWPFDFSKHLAADSQPFDLQLRGGAGWSQLPWALMALWSLGVFALLAAVVAWQRQRSERRRAQELLRLGQVGRLNALGELAAGMAHELNQPLTAVLANVQAAQRLLADEPPELETARGAMAQAVQQARRAGDVVGRLRRVVERPDLGAQLQHLRLVDAARAALDLLEPDCRRLGVLPTLEAPEAVAVVADPVALEQIVHNLLSNALQALQHVPAAERSLTLTVAAQAGQGVLTVFDSGPGILPEVLPRIFEPFFSTRPGGLGLGLSLCETLAAGMGGALTAEPAARRGALFLLALPLAAGVAS